MDTTPLSSSEDSTGRAPAPYLDLPSLLPGTGVNPALASVVGGGVPGGRGSGWRASWYQAAGEATVSYRRPGQGAHFRHVYDRETGERMRAYELEALDTAEWDHREGLIAARSAPRGMGVHHERQLAERDYWRGRGYSVPAPPALPALGAPCAKCVSRAPGVYRRGEAARRAHSEAVNNQRAASKLRRFCRSWRIDHLWTLTYRGEGEREYKALLNDVRRFFEAFKSEVGDMPMVMVREPHPGGHGWHLHFGVPGWVSIRRVRACWSHGEVNVQGRRAGSSPRKVAGYIAKYVAKGINPIHCEASGVSVRSRGQHRYWLTQGFPVVPVTYEGVDQGSTLGWLRAAAGEPLSTWDSREVVGWCGPPCFWFDLVLAALDAPPVRRKLTQRS